LHEEGPRAGGPFIVFDCTAVPPNLVESELFGHERGAFTGATATRRGVFEQAHGGTLLIDEIGDLEPPLQPKLLRGLDRSEIKRVGAERSIRVDVRVICATRRDLDRDVQAGRFRDDLFHRIAVARIELPALRRRRDDIRMLARLFWQKLGGRENALPEYVLARWEDYDWPGNVRELRNAVARYVALGDLEHHVCDDQERSTPASSRPQGMLEELVSMDLPYRSARQRLLEQFDRSYVERILAQHNGSIARAAAASGVARRHFQRVKARTG